MKMNATLNATILGKGMLEVKEDAYSVPRDAMSAMQLTIAASASLTTHSKILHAL